MKAVVGDMTISSGGILRLNKSLVESMDVRSGDRLIVLRDTEDAKITIQIQRGNNVILMLSNAEVMRKENNGKQVKSVHAS